MLATLPPVRTEFRRRIGFLRRLGDALGRRQQVQGGRLIGSPTVRGRVSRKTDPPRSAPRPSQLLWRRASSNEIARPRPVPRSCGRAGSARQNRLNTSAGLTGSQTHAVITDRHRDGAPVCRRR